MCLTLGLFLISLEPRFVIPANELLIEFVASFAHRSPHKLVVVFISPELANDSLIFSNLFVINPLGSPSSILLYAEVCRIFPGAYTSAPNKRIQPITLDHPTILAIVSSLILFCADMMNPLGFKYGLINCVHHSVSYDFTAKIA